MKAKTISPWWLVVSALALALWLPHLLALGMFMDGVYDALLAQNLYKGISTFWAPQTIHYTEPAYWDNPPLAMGALALCYKLFGNHYWVERIYSFGMAIIQLGLIGWLWRIVTAGNKNLQNYAWLPCLLWLVSPLTGWCYSNNLLENTMSCFTTLAIIAAVNYANTKKQLLLHAFSNAALLLLAFITKGPVSLFPLALATLLIGWNSDYKVKDAAIFTVLQVVFFAALFALLFLFEAPRTFLQNYFQVQLKRALTHNMPTQNKPYQIIIDLFIMLLPFIGFAAIKLALRKKLQPDTSTQSTFWRFLVLGLCGTLPIIISAKQRKFYLLPALTPFIIGFALYLQPLVQMLIEKTSERLQAKLSTAVKLIYPLVVLILAFICVRNYGVITRDGDLLHDLNAVNDVVKSDNVIRADWTLYNAWAMRGYLLRLYGKKICMPNESAPAHYYLTQTGGHGDGLPETATKVFSGKTVDLYKLPE